MHCSFLFIQLSNKKKNKNKKLQEIETNVLPMEPMKPNENDWRMEMKEKAASTSKKLSSPGDPGISKDCKKETEKYIYSVRSRKVTKKISDSKRTFCENYF